jgi:hypothetical protein
LFLENITEDWYQKNPNFFLSKINHDNDYLKLKNVKDLIKSSPLDYGSNIFKQKMNEFEINNIIKKLKNPIKKYKTI